MISIKRGNKCKAIKRCSRGCVGFCIKVEWGSGPRWVIKKIYREYAAVIKAPNPIKIKERGAQLKAEVRIKSSPVKLGRGGIAKFASAVINHQVAIKGNRICSPRIKIIVRVRVRS